MRRVCFVTCAQWPEVSESGGHVQRALHARGVAVDARAWNDPAASDLVRWNLSKRYLLDLATAGVPVVPTAVLDGDAERLPAFLDERGWPRAGVLPTTPARAASTWIA